MNYLTLFEGKTLFDKLWPLLDLRAELDLRSTKLRIHSLSSPICGFTSSTLMGNSSRGLRQFLISVLKIYHLLSTSFDLLYLIKPTKTLALEEVFYLSGPYYIFFFSPCRAKLGVNHLINFKWNRIILSQAP